CGWSGCPEGSRNVYGLSSLNDEHAQSLSMIVFIVDKHMKSFYLECTNCSFEKNKTGAKLDTSELLEGWESTV
ncbi:hypothetical protein, partial [Cylindrospermopsis raciborskii]|uniref:hypothetical protein n=1 Tax=Cylindrospermopsis raciborskii TaxID=77022 RepID=UPI0022C0AFA6